MAEKRKKSRKAAPKGIVDTLVKEMQAANKRLEVLNRWLESMTADERTTFSAIVASPNAAERIAHWQRGEYREMLLLALAVKSATNAVPLTEVK